MRRETLLRPAGAELPGTISITDDGAGRRAYVAAVADGQLLARGRPRVGEAAPPGAARVRRRGAAAAAHHGGRV